LFKLREYQTDTISKLIQNYNEGKQRNLCVLATGMGKTVIATEFHKKFKPQGRTIFLVDRIELAYQARESFQRSNPTLRVGIEMNKHHADKTHDIVVACVHTIGRKGSYRIGKFEPEDFEKIIVDEAHMAVSETYVRVLNYLGVGPDNLHKGKILIGLTATPNRTDGVGLGLVFDDITVNYDIKYGIGNGWLTDIDVLQVYTDTDISGVKATKNDFNIKQLGEALNNSHRNKLIFNAYTEFSKGEKALIYAADVKHAHGIADLFNAMDIPAFCIEANTDSKERKEAIESYKRGEIKILTNYGTLTTGFDAPETKTIILARPVKSELLLRQIVGRGLRPSKSAFVDSFDTREDRREILKHSVKPSCKVIDLYDVLGKHSVVSIPSLFGLNSNLKLPKAQERFYEEVVQRLEELEHNEGIDVTKIKNLDDIDLIVNRKRLDVTALKTPIEISEHSNRAWLPVGENKYEIVYSEDRKALIVEKNQIDQWQVMEYDSKDKLTRKLQSFQDLSGAIKLGDEYADEFYDTTWHTNREEWEYDGVSRGQMKLLIQLYKGGIRVDKSKRYEDTKVPVLYYRKTGDKLDKGKASVLISQRTGKK